ncbi:ribose ABC transport system [Klebsiella michiganensis]|uniref:Ribose ABC transport system n=1 Tax=Klebsiella michiganensis TaxID=1134687 RepID=A0A7H4MZ15_9ENTR|nr:ribose ABC transport system [Klebsiella michiganensis]
MWDRVGILIVLLVLLILMSTLAPNFNRVDNLLNIARSISVNAILAAGMTFVILTSGIDLSVGSNRRRFRRSLSGRGDGRAPCAAGDSGRRWRGRAVRPA